MKISTRDTEAITRAIANRKDFKTYGALRGENVSNSTYVVFSYRTEIARFTEGEGWTINEAKYSPTTSRHQSVVRRSLGR